MEEIDEEAELAYITRGIEFFAEMENSEEKLKTLQNEKSENSGIDIKDTENESFISGIKKFIQKIKKNKIN